LTFSQPLPAAWIERLFDLMLTTYGKHFVDQWAAAEPEKLKAHWAEKLAGYTAAEIKRGIDALDGLKFPPTLPEFQKLCRPPVDPLAAYYEAVNGIAMRERGEKGNWTHPAIFWASLAVGAFDLKSSAYPQIQGRWKTALEAEMRKGKWVDIPEPVLSLPTPSTQAADPLAAARIVEEVQQAVNNSRTDHLAWAKKIVERVKRKDKTVNHVAARMALEALQEKKQSAH
jgi:hypothetical protein